jgi:outer membrane protein, multidrug efflux system
MKWWIYILLVLAACTVGPNYCPPEICLSESFTVEDLQEEVAIPDQPLVSWWEVFCDPLLCDTIIKAARCNNTVAIAEANILQARALRTVAASDLFPHVGADLNATKTFFSKNGPLFVGQSLTGGASQTTGLPFQIQIPQTQNLYNALLDFSWEIDLFGKVRRGVEAADARICSSIAVRDGVLLSVFAEVATNYLELRRLQESGLLLEEQIALLEEKRSIETQRHTKGLTNLLEVETIEAQLAQAQAQLPQTEAKIYQAIFALSVLVGECPEALLEQLLPYCPLPELPRQVAVGLRSDLLRRRPDVRAAERDLAAATADVGVAVASFYPSISLGGVLGLQSLKLANLFTGRSKTWSVGGDILMPLFQGGNLVGNLRATEAALVATCYAYQETVLRALEEAESSLTHFQKDLESTDWLGTSVEKEGSLAALTTQRHTQGLVNTLDVIDRELKLNQAKQLELESRGLSFKDLILLYKALGGGWEELGSCVE